jgi:hypothetical protein
VLGLTQIRPLISTFPSVNSRPAQLPLAMLSPTAVNAGLRHSDGAVADPRTGRSADEEGHVHSAATGRR